MPSIITQPTGNKDAREHYLDTIEGSVNLSDFEHLLEDTDRVALKEIYPDSKIKLWGVTSGGANASKWVKIKKGDITIFSRNKLIYSSAITTYKFKNAALANYLWGENSDGETWENIYTVSEVKPLRISYNEFNIAVGYKENFVIQGFNVLSDEISERFLSVFPIESAAIFQEVSAETYSQIIENIRETDKVSTSYSRVEQGYLRKILFGRKLYENCACCGKSYPTQFLKTAHIKKRAYCSYEERLNPKIVMPMCNFGCDDLYEKGYVSVDESGRFFKKKKCSSVTVENYIESLVGNSCKYFNDESAEFFKWHRELQH